MTVMSPIANVATVGVTCLMDTLLNACAITTNLCGKLFLYSICSNHPDTSAVAWNVEVLMSGIRESRDMLYSGIA
jgi:hypothetical protein